MAEVDDLGGLLNIVVHGEIDNTRPSGTIVLISPAPGTTIVVQTTEIEITTTRNLTTDPIPQA